MKRLRSGRALSASTTRRSINLKSPASTGIGGGALRYFDRPSPWIDYTAQSSYWVFLVHMPLVCLAGWWLVPYDLPAAVKFLLVCAFTATIAFPTFHYWVQKTWISDFLHGRRFNLAWPWQAHPATAAPVA